MKLSVLRRLRRVAALAVLTVALAIPPQHFRFCLGRGAAQAVSKTESDVVEGIFHDGLGTYAEIALANELISQAHLSQQLFDVSRSLGKMRDAIHRLPATHASRAVFENE